jgi:hypothetical protein
VKVEIMAKKTTMDRGERLDRHLSMACHQSEPVPPIRTNDPETKTRSNTNTRPQATTCSGILWE